MHHTTHRTGHARRTAAPVLALLAASLLTACGGGDDPGGAPLTTVATPSTTGSPPATPTATPATTAPTTSPTAPATTEPAPATTAAAPAPSSTAPALDDPTIAAIEDMLAASLTDIAWNCCGADAPATGAAVAIRAPGASDTLIATGTAVDGSPFDPAAPFLASNLAVSLVQSVAYRLIDGGELDPVATIDAWTPQMPDAASVTVQMLVDGSTGWGDFDAALDTNVRADLTRVWSLEEVVDVAAGLEPNGGTGRDIETTVLGVILEQTTGLTLAELVEEYVTEPLGLEHTTLDAAAPREPGYQHGVFVLDGAVLDTGSVPTDAYYSFLGASGSATSTLPEALDLLDAWVSGELLGAERAATPDRFRADHPGSTATSIVGDGIPVNGYCDHRTGAELEHPCTDDADGLRVMAVGRQPNGVGTTLVLWYFPATGISVAMHHNSQEWVTSDAIRSLAIEIHDVVAAAR